MSRLQMLLNVRLIDEPPLAQRTRKRSFARMRPDMFLQLAISEIALGANVAEELLDPFGNLRVPQPVRLHHVNVQRFLILVLLEANGTLETPHVRMRLDMPLQNGPVDAPPLAQMALEIPLARVRLHVRVQVSLQGKPPVAIPANVLPQVPVHVDANLVLVQIRRRIERLWAQNAFVRPLIRVGLLVMVQIARRYVALPAKGTNVRPVARMVPLVSRKVNRTDELLPADVAFEKLLRGVHVAQMPVQ